MIKKNTDTLYEQTKSGPQETLDFNLFRSKQTSFIMPLELEEDKWLIGVNNSEVLNCFFDIVEEQYIVFFFLVSITTILQLTE